MKSFELVILILISMFEMIVSKVKHGLGLNAKVGKVGKTKIFMQLTTTIVHGSIIYFLKLFKKLIKASS